MTFSDNLTEIITGAVAALAATLGTWFTAKSKLKKDSADAADARASALMDRLQTQYDKMYAQFVKREARVQELIDQIAELQGHIAKVEANHKTLESENKKLRRALIILRKKNDELQTRLDAVNHHGLPKQQV